MKLSSSQIIILVLQTAAVLLNLYGIFISRAADSGRHWINIALVLTMTYFTLKSAAENAQKKMQ